MTRRGGQNFRNWLGQNFWNPHMSAARSFRPPQRPGGAPPRPAPASRGRHVAFGTRDRRDNRLARQWRLVLRADGFPEPANHHFIGCRPSGIVEIEPPDGLRAWGDPCEVVQRVRTPTAVIETVWAARVEAPDEERGTHARCGYLVSGVGGTPRGFDAEVLIRHCV
jgi:hypothetical protein